MSILSFLRPKEDHPSAFRAQPIHGMDELDAHFWANRHRAEQARQDRVKQRTAQRRGTTNG